jgi:hypothetical protein
MFGKFLFNLIFDSMKTDILAFGAHPDDVELGCGGTIAKMVSEGKNALLLILREENWNKRNR